MAWETDNLGGQRAAGANIREDLSNMISNISRDETPFLSAIGTNKAKGPLHEWLTDEYASPGENKFEEGFTFDSTRAGNRQVARDRLDNRTQIFGKDIISAGTVQSSDVAGVANEFAYQLKKAGVELRRDIEFQTLRYSATNQANVGNAVKVAKSGATRGQMGSVFSYVPNWFNATSDGVLRNRTATGNVGAAGAAGANLFGQVADGASLVQFATAPAANAAPAREHFEGLIAQMHRAGGKPNVAFIPVGVRTAVSSLFADGSSGSAERRIDAMMKKLNISIMGVMTDFGVDIALVHDYIMDGPAGGTGSGADNVILLADTSKVKRSLLTPVATEEDRVARYGRAAIMYCEETTEVMNPNGLGAITGVRGS